MKILLVAHKFPPHAMGGVEVYTYHLARALREQHQVSVFYRHDDVGAPAFAEHDEHVDGFQTRRVSCTAQGLRASVAGEFFDTFLNPKIEASFDRYLVQVQPDLIHIQHVMALSARLLRLVQQRGLPVLLTLHDYWFICGNSQLIWPDGQPCRGKAGGMNCVRCAAAARFPSPLVVGLRPVLAPLFLYRDRVVQRAALQAHRYISPSRFLIDRYVAAGFPSGQFTYLENGIPVGRIRAFPWRPSDGPLRVAFLGSLAWQKGVHILAEAFNGLPAGVARLRIWGDPAVFPGYAEQLRRLLTHPDAQLMGRIANERVGEVLADSDLMVVPSLWYENSPVVIQEARAAGIPVVASDLGALTEKVRHGIDGLRFPPGDVAALRRALCRFLDEPDLLGKLQEGVQPAMGMGEHVRRLQEVYRQVLEARSGQFPGPADGALRRS